MSEPGNIYPPRLNTTAKAWTQRIAVTTSSGTANLAANLAKMGWIRVKAIGADIDFTIDALGGVLVKSQVGVTTDVGYTLQAGQAEDFYIALKGQTGVITTIASGAGFLQLARAGRDEVIP